MTCPRFKKDPSDKRIITGDFATWLGTANISAVAWTVPTGLAAANDSFTDKTVTNYFTGGENGQEYEVKVTITTNESVARLKSQSFMLEVESGCDC